MKVFLSHSSKDKEIVSKVHSKLGKRLTWFDAADIETGESIPEKVCEGIERCTHFVLFWSANSANARWVKAELNAAFVKLMNDKCKFIIVKLDKTKLPILLQPYKYDEFSMEEEEEDIVSGICETILKEENKKISRNTFVNRTAELGDIEDAIRDNCKIIILTGILGIGKSSLALRANKWIYGQETTSVIIDFNQIPGNAELAIELYRKLRERLDNDNDTLDLQMKNIEYALEKISYKIQPLILKDVKGWLKEDGSPNASLSAIFNKVITSEMFSDIPLIVTSSRYINVDICENESIRVIKIKALDDSHIEEIIKNHLLKSFTDFDSNKNKEFASFLYGYPLGARLAANNISVNGYDYYLMQNHRITTLKIGLAKQLISYASISAECKEYLKSMALVQSKMTNEEYVEAGLIKDFELVGVYSEEAFLAGLVNIDQNGCYRLEHIVTDYYYDLAFNDKELRKKLNLLEKYLMNKIKAEDISLCYRLLPLLVHIMTLNNHTKEAFGLKNGLVETMSTSMWDLYNHREYDEAYNVASAILISFPENADAMYIQALSNIRNGRYEEARKTINFLMGNDGEYYRYYYAIGRIEKYLEHYEEAIIYFEKALEKYKRHASSMREIAECYYFLGDLNTAHKYINQAKGINEDNVWTVLLECRILSKEGKNKEALEAINKESLLVDDPSQILFRKGRIYDEMDETNKAIQCYEQALEYNQKQYDARLCLLHHKIMKEDCLAEINELEKKLKGKRQYILLNIKARYIGYFGHEEESALEILDAIDSKFIDQQWYAVKIQLLEKICNKHKSAGRSKMADKCVEKIEDVQRELFERFNKNVITDVLLLPDA